LFDAATIQRMLGHLQTLLEGIVARPDQPIADLPLVTPGERQQLLVEWNDTHTDYPRNACIHELFEAQVERTPEAVAIVFGNQSLTYRQLNQQANQLAHYLQKLGVKPGAMVGICVERSLDMVVGFLAIIKIGAGYVPLDPTYPKERLDLMLGDSRITALLVHKPTKPNITTQIAHLVCLDAERERIACESEQNLCSEVTADSTAYVMYTSGSTGKPKGIAIPHRAISRLVFDTNYIRIESNDRIAQASNASFDAATFEIWGALLHGARLVGISRDVVLSPQDFAAQLWDQGISILFLTTALFNQLARETPNAFRSIRTLLFGGEAVDPLWVSVVLRNDPPERLLHVYGPTESTTFTTWYLVRDVAEGGATVPIGCPISNTQVYILDSHFNPAPVGVPGELCISGDGLARGYLNRPDLTAEKFLPNPFGAPGARLYRTGDLVRYLPNGNIEFLGRIDHQVKLRGFRIELGEIEATLAQTPGVSEAVVLAREDRPDEKRLVAYLIPQAGRSPTARELREALQSKLPDYMIPSAFVTLDAFPLTPNGKVDRRALPIPEGRSSEAEGFIAPRTPTEEILAGIWANVLGVERISVNDSFFEMGGHSLLATQVISRVRQAFEVELPLRRLFESPTVAGLAECIENALWIASDHRSPTTHTNEHEEIEL
jgi:amino acid adenylation domain-containing protein